VRTGYERHRDAFRRAAPFLPYRVEPVSIPFTGAPMPGYLYRAAAEGPRPTVLFTGGFDGTAEELHKYGALAALEAGWNAVAWDGPGQGGMLVEHGMTMVPGFENVLTAVVDWTAAQSFADPRRLLLVGRSLGGYLAPRGASAEPRIAALVCDPGQFDFTSRFRSMFSDEDWQKVLDADPDMDAALDFASQSGVLFDALRCPKQYRQFTVAEGGGGHCEGMGQRLWQQAVFSWLGQVVAGG
jgi:pimeloyl-ACP methyl ester carboxylesterase